MSEDSKDSGLVGVGLGAVAAGGAGYGVGKWEEGRLLRTAVDSDAIKGKTDFVGALTKARADNVAQFNLAETLPKADSFDAVSFTKATGDKAKGYVATFTKNGTTIGTANITKLPGHELIQGGKEAIEKLGKDGGPVKLDVIADKVGDLSKGEQGSWVAKTAKGIEQGAVRDVGKAVSEAGHGAWKNMTWKQYGKIGAGVVVAGVAAKLASDAIFGQKSESYTAKVDADRAALAGAETARS